MEMPTPCAQCGTEHELNDLVPSLELLPEGGGALPIVCPDCHTAELGDRMQERLTGLRARREASAADRAAFQENRAHGLEARKMAKLGGPGGAVCVRRARPDELYGPCPDCGHPNIVHPNPAADWRTDCTRCVNEGSTARRETVHLTVGTERRWTAPKSGWYTLATWPPQLVEADD